MFLLLALTTFLLLHFLCAVVLLRRRRWKGATLVFAAAVVWLLLTQATHSFIYWGSAEYSPLVSYVAIGIWVLVTFSLAGFSITRLQGSRAVVNDEI